jgi:hypothetical protein
LIAGWLVLDLRWLGLSLEQARNTRAHYTASEIPDGLAIEAVYDEDTIRAVNAVKEMMGDGPPQRIILATMPGGTTFQALRAKYALLPHAAYAHTGAYETIPPSGADALLLLSPTRAGAKPIPPAFLEVDGKRFESSERITGAELYMPAGN